MYLVDAHEADRHLAGIGGLHVLQGERRETFDGLVIPARLSPAPVNRDEHGLLQPLDALLHAMGSLVVGPYDTGHQIVAHDVGTREVDEGYLVDAAEYVAHALESGASRGKVDLRGICPLYKSRCV